MDTLDGYSELHSLIDQLCAGALSDSDRRLLNDLLRNSDENCAVYLRYMAIHASLAYVGREITSFAPSIRRQVVDDDQPSRRSVERVRRRPYVAVAAATVVLLLTAIYFIVPPLYTALTRVAVVAEITGTDEARWADGEVGARQGAQLAAGDRLELESGRVELWYPDGVRIVLEGPCNYIVEGRRAGRLQRGKLVAQIVQQSVRSFTINTPTARVEDLGTEFGVEVQEDGDAEVIVLSGEVEVVDQAERRERIRLIERQSAHIASSGTIAKREEVDVGRVDTLRDRLAQDFGSKASRIAQEIADRDKKLPDGKTITNSLGMTLVRIDPGEFTMGEGAEPPKSREEWEERDWDESPSHLVKISEPYFLSTCEVTNIQYERFDPAHKKSRGLHLGGSRVTSADDEPVTAVSWYQAMAFCKWLSEKEGRTYRLPSEAEWEYAARAGSKGRFGFGDDDSELGEYAWFASNSQNHAIVVAGKKPNNWGLYDMHGNVEEWCLDWHGPYTSAKKTDPAGRSDGYAKVTRGGNFHLTGRYCRSSNRSGCLPDDARNPRIGFRVVLADHTPTKMLPAEAPPLFKRNINQTPAKVKISADKPYYDGFDGRRPTIPPESWGPLLSHHNHNTAIAACPNGDVLFTWKMMVNEGFPDNAIAVSRLPAGSDTWQPASVMMDVPDINHHKPSITSDGQRLYFLATHAIHGWKGAAGVLSTSDDNGATWTKPKTFVQRPSERDPVLANNLRFGCTFLDRDGKTIWAAMEYEHQFARSSDGGKTWEITESVPHSSAKKLVHPAVTQLPNGTLVAFWRGDDPMPMTRSKDGGKTWDLHKTDLPGIFVGERASVLTLASGGLLVLIPGGAKAIGERGALAALSPDGGDSWAHVRTVADIRGYSSLTQAPNGIIYAGGSKMHCAAFNEAWLREGKSLKKARSEQTQE